MHSDTKRFPSVTVRVSTSFASAAKTRYLDFTRTRYTSHMRRAASYGFYF